ncbi:class I SAM-dependent methyltransferase [Arcticibacter sp. MXS-1]|uniref:class I SAM-dependent methyltransferase n=1 Tax=Arcticibacter sp. MXS-1 TaxID=3341726 RepID=UPI0035A83F62
MSNTLTDRSFWSKYWESKKGLAFSVNRNYLFHQHLSAIVEKKQPAEAIELGGFPGYYAIFLKKHFHISSTLLDYFVHPGILQQVLQANGLTEGDIHVIEADLFNCSTPQQYDLVLSCGLIEHFNDTRDIIQRHVQFVKPGGTLFITLPNFRGVNGWFQKEFDLENYEKHNIASMDPDLLRSIAVELNLKDVKASYYGGFSVWLENKNSVSALTKLFMKSVWFAGKVITKTFRFESRALSPYIVLQATK